MTDAPETIWVGSDICHDDFGPEPNIWKDEASSYETDIKYTRADVAQARIDEAKDARIAQLEAAIVTARNDALQEAADVCTVVIKEYDVMKPNGTTYEPLKVQKAAKGMVSIARQDIKALKDNP
jgi:hypothetical protein